MVNIADPVTRWAFLMLISVMMGTCLLITIALFRRWQQIRYNRYFHTLQCKYRPVLAKLLSGTPSAAGIESLRELPLAELELLFDPLFAKRKLTEQSRRCLLAVCAELGLLEVWQSRVIFGTASATPFAGDRAPGDSHRRPIERHLLRAKSIRNLGALRHQQSWILLVDVLDDRHPDIQMVALRSLAKLRAPESFPVLREWFHAVVQGKTSSPPLPGLQSAMVSFDLACLPALLPSLRHADRQIRMLAARILRTMVCREAARRPRVALTHEILSAPIVELLLTELAHDMRSEIRACAAEVIVYLSDRRATPVLRNLLVDPQWFVRLRTVQALPNLRQAVAHLHLDIRRCLSDVHWRVREVAIRALIALGEEGKHQLVEHFLTSKDRTTREQIVEVIERTGLMSSLVEAYSAGSNGMAARMVEQLASDAAPMGLSGILRTLNPVIRQQFLDRFLPYAEARLRFHEEIPLEENATTFQEALEFPPRLVA